MDISVCLVVGSFPGGILVGIGGGDRRVPLLGSLGRIGSGALLSSARRGNLSNVVALGGNRRTLVVYTISFFK